MKIKTWSFFKLLIYASTCGFKTEFVYWTILSCLCPTQCRELFWHTLVNKESESVSHSVVSNSLWPHGLQPARFLCPWDSKQTRPWEQEASHSPQKGLENPVPKTLWEKEEPMVQEIREAVKCHLGDMLYWPRSVNASKPSEKELVRQEEAEDSASITIFWVSKVGRLLGQVQPWESAVWPSVGVFSNDWTHLVP